MKIDGCLRITLSGVSELPVGCRIFAQNCLRITHELGFNRLKINRYEPGCTTFSGVALFLSL
jgi:hypothetical protein